MNHSIDYNYRIVEYPDRTCYIHEVYYENGEIEGLSENPSYPAGVSEDDLNEDLLLMLRAFELPTIQYDDVKGLFLMEQPF